jgi:hypothetical protein
MPARKITRRISTPAGQGDDSWVEIRQVTVREVEQGLLKRGKPDETSGDEAARYIENAQMIIGRLASWNWVDEQGQSLPLPQDVEGVRALYAHEVEALVQAIINPDLKN